MTLIAVRAARRERRARCTRAILVATLASLALSAAACGEQAAPAARGLGGDTALVASQRSERVSLSADAMIAADIRVQQARPDTSRADDDTRSLQVPGQVELDPRRVTVVSSRIDGRIERLHVVEGDPVQDAQPVAELYSQAFASAQGDLQQAERRVSLLRTSPDSQGARALADAAAQRLVLMGSGTREIEALRNGEAAAQTLVLRSPLTGSVLQAHVLVGTHVAAGQPVFTVADLTVLDVVAEVPEASLSLVRVGQRATIGIAAFPQLRFVGSVERLRDVLNAETRTVRAVIHVPNRSRSLRPGMYASVRLELPRAAKRGAARTGVVLPESAIVTDGAATVVFVEVAPSTFERRVVRSESLSPPGSMRPAGQDVRITDGLRAGERVVVHGAFLLKSELAKGALAEDK